MFFSQRHGYKPINEIIQIDKIDIELRNALWDGLSINYWDLIKSSYTPDIEALFKDIWHSYLKKPIDTMPYNWDSKYKIVREYYFQCQWYEVYDFIEFVANCYNPEYSFSTANERRNINNNFKSFCNCTLERENSGYRFVDSYITKITSQQEIESIEKAMERGGKYKPVRIHIDTALKLCFLSQECG